MSLNAQVLNAGQGACSIGTTVIAGGAVATVDLEDAGVARDLITYPQVKVIGTPEGGGSQKFSLAAVDSAGGMVSWQNSTGFDLMVTRAILDVTTIATGACTVSVGQTNTNGTTLSANLISGQDVHSATGTFSSTASVKVAAGKWVTASVASGASAGIVGKLYLVTIPV